MQAKSVINAIAETLRSDVSEVGTRLGTSTEDGLKQLATTRRVAKGTHDLA